MKRTIANNSPDRPVFSRLLRQHIAVEAGHVSLHGARQAIGHLVPFTIFPQGSSPVIEPIECVGAPWPPTSPRENCGCGKQCEMLSLCRPPFLRGRDGPPGLPRKPASSTSFLETVSGSFVHKHADRVLPPSSRVLTQ